MKKPVTKPSAKTTPAPLPVVTIKGSPRQCGELYGEIFRTALHGFYALEMPETNSLLGLTSACLSYVEKHAAWSWDFIRGAARSSGLTLEQLCHLSLHEEFVHTEHCTGIIASGTGAGGKKPGSRGSLIGQNWDWKPYLFPWPSILRIEDSRKPATTTYNYPGLWASAGINEKGLALLWTGAGYYPRIPTRRAGMPTYIIISELLKLRDTAEAVKFLKSIELAGCFVFLIGDQKGHSVIAEGLPGMLAVETVDRVSSRANHYMLPETIAHARQELPDPAVYNTTLRYDRACALASAAGAALSPAKLRQALADKPLIHRFGLNSMTIDSLVADCHEVSLSVMRGGPEPGKWQKY